MLLSKIIKKKFDAVLGRYDGDPALYYFSAEDYPGLKCEKFDAAGDRGVALKGFFYYYKEFCPQNLIVFDHGIGAGHLAYLPEIEYLAKNGYTVYAYDHTGCVSTAGSGILGFAQGVNDLDHVLYCLKQDERFKDVPFKLMGHSWGGYSAMNAAALHPEVTHVVSLAGFLSAKSLIEQYIPKMFLRYSPEVMDRERKNNPEYADMDARDSLKKSKAKLLYLQSRDDVKVKFELGGEPLSQALKGRKNTEFVVVDHRNHDPHHTDNAAKLNAQMLLDLEKLHKNKNCTRQDLDAFKKNHNWEGIVEEDPVMWEKILKFLCS